MKGKALQYKEAILAYLKAKYNEEFALTKLSRRIALVEPEYLLASCHSLRFSGDPFDVKLVVPPHELYKDDMIVKLFEEAGAYNPADNKEEGQRVFQDDYINVLMQNQMDQQLKDIDAVFVKTQVTTPNMYPNDIENITTMDDFVDRYSKAVVYTSVFVKSMDDLSPAFLQSNSQKIINSKIRDQFIFYYVTDSSADEIAAQYAENYDDNNAFFCDSPGTKHYWFERYALGEKKMEGSV